MNWWDAPALDEEFEELWDLASRVLPPLVEIGRLVTTHDADVIAQVASGELELDGVDGT